MSITVRDATLMAAVTVVTDAELPTESSSRSRPGPEQHPLRRDKKELQTGMTLSYAPRYRICPRAVLQSWPQGQGQGHRLNLWGGQELGSQGSFPSTPKHFNLCHRQRQKSKLTYTNSGPQITEISCPFSRHEHPRLRLQKRISAYVDPR